MLFRKKLVRAVLSLIVSMVFTAQAEKSAFIISKHSSPSQAQAYRIDADKITYQAQVDIGTYNQGYGAVGNAVWPDKELMFVTYENSPMVVWASTKTLEKVGEFNTGISSCAGIVIDEDKAKIYIIRRAAEQLYVYSFNHVNNTLVLDSQYDLETWSGYIDAWGLALDEDKDLLYVSDGTHTVYYYDTNDWSLAGSIDIEVNSFERNAIGIAVDALRGYLYTGDWQDHNYLVRTLTASPHTSTEIEITKNGYPSKQLIGVDVDEETGLVYCTTYHNDFRVYDSNLILTDTNETNISGPAGVAVGGSYKLPLFYLKKVDVNEPNCVVSGENITYEITYGPNSVDHNNLIITDFLPDDLLFIYASGPNSVYHPDTHTVTWNIGRLDANEPYGSVTLTVKVNDCVSECGTITNYCEVESDYYYSYAETNTPVCSASSPDPTCGEIVELRTGKLNLSWCPGVLADATNGHEVYLGTSYSEVYNANTFTPNIYKGTVTDPCHQISFNEFALDTTYYWRVDEVSASHPDSPWKGGIWSFTTSDYLVVDDFEDYGVTVTYITDRWDDYVINGTSADIYIESSPAFDEQSMRYKFWNLTFPPYYSEATFDITQTGVDMNTDFVSMGIQSLSLWFYGESTNTGTEPMYAILSDGTTDANVTYRGDMNDVKEEQWHEWNISMQEFLDANSSLNLSDIRTIGIGFAEGLPANGNVYFDDIRLYLNKCVPGYYPPGDFDSDCDVDFYDFMIFARVWLIDEPDISLDSDNDVDVYDLDIFCDNWLWQEGGEMSMAGSSFGGGDSFIESLYTVSPPEQPQPKDFSEELYIEETKKTIELIESMLSQLAEDDVAKEILDDWLEELKDQL